MQSQQPTKEDKIFALPTYLGFSIYPSIKPKKLLILYFKLYKWTYMDVNTLNLSITSRIYLPSIGPLLLLADLDQGDSVKKQLEMKLQGICFYTSCRLHPFGLFLSANAPFLSIFSP